MKILIVTPGRLPVPAVSGGAVENLIEVILNYNEKYHMADIAVISSYDKNAAEKSIEYKNSKLYFFKRNAVCEMMMQKHFLPYRFFDICFSIKAGRFLKKKEYCYDVIIIQNEPVNGWIIKWYLQGKYIYHAHSCLMKNSKRDIKFLRSCDKVISVSNYISEYLCRKMNIDQVYTIYNEVNTELFNRYRCHEKRMALRKQYGIKPDETVVVFAGRLTPEKGIGVLLDAIREIAKEYKIILLVIGESFFRKSGDSAFVKRLKMLSMPIKNQIIFTGYVNYREMPDYYSMSDIGCVPSQCEEAFGLSVVEQMAMELPVIASDVGAISEILDSSCGYLIPQSENMSEEIADAVIDLCIHPEKRNLMGQSGRKKVISCFRQEQFCKNWFDAVLKRSGGD